MSNNKSSSILFDDKLIEKYFPQHYNELLSYLIGYESQVVLTIVSTDIGDQLYKSIELFYSFYLWSLQFNGNDAQIKQILNDIEGTDDGNTSPLLSFLSKSELIQNTIKSIDSISNLKFDIIYTIPASYQWSNHSKYLEILIKDIIRSLQNSIYLRIISNFTQIRITKLRLYLGISSNLDDTNLLNELNSRYHQQDPTSPSKWEFKSQTILIPPSPPSNPPNNETTDSFNTKLQTLINLASHLETEPL